MKFFTYCRDFIVLVKFWLYILNTDFDQPTINVFYDCLGWGFTKSNIPVFTWRLDNRQTILKLHKDRVFRV